MTDRKERKEQEAFDATTKGIGKKLLMRMGWNEGAGLGKEGEGIVKPIEVSLRPKGFGLGFIGEQDAQKATADLYKQPRKTDELSPHERPWKRMHKAKLDRVDVEYLGSSPPSLKSAGKIIDMTGPEVRELDSLSALSGYRTHDPIAEDGQFPELVQAVRRLAMQAGNEQRRAKAREREEELRNRELAADIDAAKHASMKLDADLRQKRQLQLLVQQGKLQSGLFRSAVMADEDTSEQCKALFRIGDQLERLNRERPSMEIVKSMLALFAEPIRFVVARWDPLGQHDDLVVLFSILADYEVETPEKVSVDICYQLMLRYWLPPVRSALVNRFDPSDERCALFATRWNSLMKGDVRRTIVNMIMLKKMEEAVERASLEDTWIAGWISVFVENKELITAVRRKMAACLERAELSDAGLKEKVLFWTQALPRHEADLLLGRVILPRLASFLEHNFIVNPASQDIDPLLTVLGWSDVVPLYIMADILKTGMFAKLRRTLHSWMADAEADLDEVAEWYTAWKSVLSEELVAHPVVDEEFRYLLAMMNALLEDPTLPVTRFV